MSNLSASERLAVIRTKDRPTVMDYIPAIFNNFLEMHGDRFYGDDAAIIGGARASAPPDEGGGEVSSSRDMSGRYSRRFLRGRSRKARTGRSYREKSDGIYDA